jgi:hypothetical protein
MIADLAVVSAADSTYFDLLQAMVRSLRDRAVTARCMSSTSD